MSRILLDSQKELILTLLKLFFKIKREGILEYFQTPFMKSVQLVPKLNKEPIKFLNKRIKLWVNTYDTYDDNVKKSIKYIQIEFKNISNLLSIMIKLANRDGSAYVN